MSEGRRPVNIDIGMAELSAKAYREIRSRIINGLFNPGEHITERALCEITKVSRTPVREALRRLAAEGMLLGSEKRGFFVTIVDRQEIIEIFDLIFLLSGYTLRIAAQNVSQTRLDELKDLVDQMEIVMLREDGDLYEAFTPLGRSFRTTIRETVGNQYLGKIMRDLMVGQVVLQAVLRFTRNHYEICIRLYRDLYEALRDRDPDRAEIVVHELDAIIRDLALSAFAVHELPTEKPS